MSRLITFGCSYTYGQGLPDCENTVVNTGIKNFYINSSTSSKQGWPSILSKQLDLELVNISAPGASNFEILHNILNFKFKETDTVIIMWSHYLRDLYFRNFLTWICSKYRLGVWQKHFMVRKIVRKWIEQMNERDFNLKSWVYIHHADLYLKTKNVRYVHFPAVPDELTEHPCHYKIDNFYTQGIPLLDTVADGHPGILSNNQTANLLHEILKNVS